MSSLACSGWTHLIFQLVHCLSRKLSSDSSMLYVFHSNSTTNVFCTLVAALGVVMSIWGFCRRRHKLNQTLVCKYYNTLSVAIICSKTSCCEYKLYLQDRVLFKYNETLQTWMLVLCKENTLSCVQCQKLSISFRFLN